MPDLPLAADASGHAVHGLLHALVSRHAVCVARAVLDTRPVGAKEGRAVHECGLLARSHSVAGPGRVLDRARARGRTARRILRVQGARAQAIAKAGVAAGSYVAGIARGVGLARRNERAEAHRSGLIARHAWATARDVAAHAIRAEARGTLGRARRAGLAGGFRAAARSHALLSSRALGIGRASKGASVGRWIASVGRTGQGTALGALAVAVAGKDARHAVPVARAGLALGAIHVKATPALSVAGSILPAGRRRTGCADQGIVGFHTRRNESTVTQGAGQVAGFARLSTGRGATEPVHAESGLALVVAATEFGLPLGLADRARRANVGLLGVCGAGAVGGSDVVLPAIQRAATAINADLAEGALRATTGAQDRAQGKSAPERSLNSNSPRISSH